MAAPTRLGDAITDLSNWLTTVRVQEQATMIRSLPGEVEHLADGTGNSIKRTRRKPRPAEPVVLDEPNHRSLIGHGVIDIVLSRPRGDDQEGLTRSITAAAKCVCIFRVNAG